VFDCLPSLCEEDGDDCITFSEQRIRLDGGTRHLDHPLTFAFEGRPDFTQPVPQPPVESSLQPRGVVAQQTVQRGSQPSRPKPYDCVPDELEEGEVSDSPPPLESNSKGKPRRRRRRRQSLDATRSADPRNAPSMNCKKRRSLAGAVADKAQELKDSCVFPLEPPPHIAKVNDIVKAMELFWDWLDRCHHALDSLQDEPDKAHFNWSILRPAFMHLSRIRGVYGAQWLSCRAAFKKRKPWISKRTFDNQALVQAVSVEQDGEYGLLLARYPFS
jgi:hypothetical protein